MASEERETDLAPPIFRDVSSSARLESPRLLDEADVRDLMWKSVGLFRERSALREAVNQLQAQEAMLEAILSSGTQLDHAGWRRASIVTVGSLIAQAALRREESRGGHFRIDHPAHDDSKWKIHVSDVIHRS